MEEGITLHMWQFILAGLGFVVTCVVNTWGVVKYLIGRQDKQNMATMQRIDEVQRAGVTREDYLRDTHRLHADIGAVREAVERQGAAGAARMDQILLAVGRASKN
jgi:hypothetical protein